MIGSTIEILESEIRVKIESQGRTSGPVTSRVSCFFRLFFCVIIC